MATGNIVSAWKDATAAYMAVSVPADASVPSTSLGPLGQLLSGSQVLVAAEYVASTPLRDAAGALKPDAQLKLDLVAAVSARRAAALGASASPLAASGQVAV